MSAVAILRSLCKHNSRKHVPHHCCQRSCSRRTLLQLTFLHLIPAICGSTPIIALSMWIVQDYEMALSTLRLLCSDLKADKKWRQYAGAQVQCSVPMVFAVVPAGITSKFPMCCSDPHDALTCTLHLPHFNMDWSHWQSK